MSTICLAHQSRRPTIGAHADHKTTDFFFPRVQSLESRDLPWESRIKPMRSWLEIGLYGFVVATVGVATLAFV